MHVAADVGGSSFYEVTFYAKAGDGAWRSIGTDDTAPYQVFHDVERPADGHHAAVPRGRARQRRAHRDQPARAQPPCRAPLVDHRGARARAATSAAPSRCGRSPTRSAPRHVGARSSAASPAARGRRSAPTTPRRRTRCSTTSPRWTWPPAPRSRTGPSSPSRTDRRHQRGPHGAVRGPAADPGDAALLPAGRRLRRSASAGWGLHMWGDAVDPAVLAQIAWDRPWPRTRVADGWAEYDIPLVDDTQAGELHHAPAQRRLRAGHPRAGR